MNLNAKYLASNGLDELLCNLIAEYYNKQLSTWCNYNVIINAANHVFEINLQCVCGSHKSLFRQLRLISIWGFNSSHNHLCRKDEHSSTNDN